ncbi:MAG TPA: hypothetical protein VH255_10335 [Verrucomicrobiae bacterium]|nr:hypothetical protein [Verrucomicrobiae bacterium]
MKSSNAIAKEQVAIQGAPWKSTRRTIDAAGLALFHIATIGLVAWADPRQASGIALLAVPVLALDILYFFAKPKHRPVLEPKLGAAGPAPTDTIGSFAVEYLVLLVPPIVMVSCFLWLIWDHQAITVHQQIMLLAAMPAVVSLVSWIIYLRMTGQHKGVKNSATKFIALAMLATWIGSTFLFFLLLACCLLKAGLR